MDGLLRVIFFFVAAPQAVLAKPRPFTTSPSTGPMLESSPMMTTSPAPTERMPTPLEWHHSVFDEAADLSKPPQCGCGWRRSKACAENTNALLSAIDNSKLDELCKDVIAERWVSPATPFTDSSRRKQLECAARLQMRKMVQAVLQCQEVTFQEDCGTMSNSACYWEGQAIQACGVRWSVLTAGIIDPSDGRVVFPLANWHPILSALQANMFDCGSYDRETCPPITCEWRGGRCDVSPSAFFDAIMARPFLLNVLALADEAAHCRARHEHLDGVCTDPCILEQGICQSKIEVNGFTKIPPPGGVVAETTSPEPPPYEALGNFPFYAVGVDPKTKRRSVLTMADALCEKYGLDPSYQYYKNPPMLPTPIEERSVGGMDDVMTMPPPTPFPCRGYCIGAGESPCSQAQDNHMFGEDPAYDVDDNLTMTQDDWDAVLVFAAVRSAILPLQVQCGQYTDDYHSCTKVSGPCDPNLLPSGPSVTPEPPPVTPPAHDGDRDDRRFRHGLGEQESFTWSMAGACFTAGLFGGVALAVLCMTNTPRSRRRDPFQQCDNDEGDATATLSGRRGHGGSAIE